MPPQPAALVAGCKLSAVAGDGQLLSGQCSEFWKYCETQGLLLRSDLNSESSQLLQPCSEQLVIGFEVIPVSHFIDGVNVLDRAGQADRPNSAATTLNCGAVLSAAWQNRPLTTNLMLCRNRFQIFDQAEI